MADETSAEMSEGITASFAKRFTGGPEIRVEALQTSAQAGVTVLFGASGAGKTTVLRCLAGLERPDEGTIRFGEEMWSDAGRGVFVPPRERRITRCFHTCRSSETSLMG